MSMFPGPGAIIIRNEAGEPLGWDYYTDEPEYCDMCGGQHSGSCWPDLDDDDED